MRYTKIVAYSTTYVSRPYIGGYFTAHPVLPRRRCVSLSVSIDAFLLQVFPTRFRASAHGISAAGGKVGAIISALAFNTLSKKVGTPIVLWSA